MIATMTSPPAPDALIPERASIDYARVEQAIRYLDQHARKQPELAEVARAVGLSDSHFQRLFTRWAGISPKRFLQFQTIEHAKRLLAESRSLLDVSYEAGLSGQGRLHDLFVAIEGMTPGQFRGGGAGARIAYGVHDTPFGDCLVAATERGICALAFLGDQDRESALEELARRWPGAALERDDTGTARLVRRIFDLDPARSANPLAVVLKGTNFQLKVWNALLRIPPGGVASYEDVAAAVGAPGAVRAVASAVARNPVAYLIPCHRVIRKTGAFGEYRWGAPRKRAILTWERAHAEGRGPRAA